ncbi:MAG: hypothetical protein JO179_07590, partial [Solirubrobacterales bacterium]|nr:hypothetical protein [Solirubrobacterales bacterium]
NVRAQCGDLIELAQEPYAAANGADAIVLVTEWHALRAPDFARLKSVMRQCVAFDGRNVWLPNVAREHGFSYYGIGRR